MEESAKEESLEDVGDNSENERGQLSGEIQGNSLPPGDSEKFKCGIGEFASDGGQLVKRFYFQEKAISIDYWKTKRARHQIVRATSDISGRILHSLMSEEEATSCWKQEIENIKNSPRKAKLSPRTSSVSDTSGGRSNSVDKRTVATIPLWAIKKDSGGGFVMVTPDGVETGSRNELIERRRSWHEIAGVSLQETIENIARKTRG